MEPRKISYRRAKHADRAARLATALGFFVILLFRQGFAAVLAMGLLVYAACLHYAVYQCPYCGARVRREDLFKLIPEHPVQCAACGEWFVFSD